MIVFFDLESRESGIEREVIYGIQKIGVFSALLMDEVLRFSVIHNFLLYSF